MADVPWLNPGEERAWRALRRLLYALPARTARDLAAAGLSATDYEVMSTLSEKPGHRWGLKDLAMKMEWSRSRLSHHVARMEERGLVDREADPADARGSIYHLTTSGYTALKRAAPLHVRSVRDRFIDHLSPEELAVVEGISNRIADLPD